MPGVIEQNRKEFEIAGIFKFWNSGYTGKGIKIAEIETANPKSPIFAGRLKDPFGLTANGKYSDHGQQVLDVMAQVAPDAELYMLPSGLALDEDKAEGAFLEKTLPYAVENKIHIIGASLLGVNNKGLSEAIKKAQEQGVAFVTSAGNRGEGGLGDFARSNVWISVGAVGYKDISAKIYRKDYSSVGKELDIVSFSGLYVRVANNPAITYQVEGTSFSSPMVVGMLALVQQFFLEKTGRTLYQDELEAFIRDHVIDLGEAGFDEKYGYGLFVLPDPSEIQVEKYLLRKPPKEVKKRMPKVVIDPGHGGLDPGAVGPTGLKEKDIALWVAQRLPLFLPKEVEVVYTREEDKTVELDERVNLANANQADIFVSIHCNSAEDASAHGTETFCYKFGGNGERLAKLVQQQVIKLTGLTDRGVKEANFQVLRETKMPAVLIELAFISNLAEEALLKKDSFRLNFCRAIANAVRQYFGFGEHLQPETKAGGDKTMAKDYAGHWAEKTIDAVKALGIMAGDPDGKFRPNDAVTRAELAQALFNLFNAVKKLYELS